MKTAIIAEILTPAQIEEVTRLWGLHGPGITFVNTVTAQVIEPALPEINRKLGQENNARFIAYAIHHALGG